MKHETGTTSHLDRMNLTRRLCELLDALFKEHEIDFMEYGQNVILQQNLSLVSRWRKLDVKKSPVVLMEKFSPDYLMYHKSSNRLFMMDAKASITPMFFNAAIVALRDISGDQALDRHSIGEIEREAWDNYTERFPKKKVAICFATPYNPNLVLVEWASELKALFRFVEDTNVNAAGSRTPHVNIDLSAMRPLNRFLRDELGIAVDREMYGDLLSEVKTWGLNKPAGRVNWTQFNNVVMTLRGKCPWIRGRVPKGSKYDGIRDRLNGLAIDYDEIEV
jgi:hypothetical protein